MLHRTMKVRCSQVVDVLVVDPQPLICQLVAEMLEDAGLRVVAAVADTAEAREVFARRDAATPAVLVVATRRAAGRDGSVRIPIETSHRFGSKPAACSEANQPGIPMMPAGV